MHMLFGRRLFIALVLAALLASPAQATGLEGPSTVQGLLAQAIEWFSALWSGEAETTAPSGPSEPNTVPQDSVCLDGCDRGMGVDPNG
jgi:hypothetical protein